MCISSIASQSLWITVPDDTIFPSTIADQDFPRFSLSYPMYLTQEIDTLEGRDINFREMLKFGGVQSLFRFIPNEDKPFSVELSFRAGLITLFDTFEDNMENFGWEGTGSITLDVSVTEDLIMRFGYHHISSHVGDEYLTQYGTLSFPIASGSDLESGDTYGMNYVRDSLYGGISYTINDNLRVYGEARYSMDMLRYMQLYNDFPWQADVGAEYIWPSPQSNTYTWFAALHVSMYEETSWFPSTAVRVGRVMRVADSNRQFHFGVELYYGRAEIEVFNHTAAADPTVWDDVTIESYIAVGAWYDL